LDREVHFDQDFDLTLELKEMSLPKYRAARETVSSREETYIKIVRILIWGAKLSPSLSEDDDTQINNHLINSVFVVQVKPDLGTAA